MGQQSLSLEDAVTKLIEVASDASSGRADIVKAAKALRTTRAFRRHAEEDPLLGTVWDVLSACQIHETEGHVVNGDHPLTIPELCSMVGMPATQSSYARVGKICAHFGYRRLLRNMTWPTPRILAPRHLW